MQHLNVSCLAINEPDCLINNFYNSGIQVMDFFKHFVIGYCHEASNAISRDELLSIGCLILDYQMPMMEDAYYLEA